MLEDWKCMGDSIGHYSLLRSVLESCRKVLEVGTSKYGTYYQQVRMSLVLLETAEQMLFTPILN